MKQLTIALIAAFLSGCAATPTNEFDQGIAKEKMAFLAELAKQPTYSCDGPCKIYDRSWLQELDLMSGHYKVKIAQARMWERLGTGGLKTIMTGILGYKGLDVHETAIENTGHNWSNSGVIAGGDVAGRDIVRDSGNTTIGDGFIGRDDFSGSRVGTDDDYFDIADSFHHNGDNRDNPVDNSSQDDNSTVLP